MLKRYFDIVISLCVLFMALPLLIIVAILIQISMGDQSFFVNYGQEKMHSLLNCINLER